MYGEKTAENVGKIRATPVNDDDDKCVPDTAKVQRTISFRGKNKKAYVYGIVISITIIRGVVSCYCIRFVVVITVRARL